MVASSWLGSLLLSVLVLVGFENASVVAVPQTQPALGRRPADPVPPDVARPPADAVKSPSGLISKVLTPGTGTVHPVPADTVTVWYTGWTTNGKMIDSSSTRGKPATFRLNRVMQGWQEGVQAMVVGERRRLWIPETLGYEGRTDRPKGMIVFDIELVDIGQAPVAPPDVATVPPDAETSRSGLAWKVLQPGTGTRHALPSSTVTVHYTGWTTDGQMFDSSVARGQPATFRLDQVIEGWSDGVQLMVEGERRRFWIPEPLAYKGEAGSPAGMLVFDVELIAIK